MPVPVGGRARKSFLHFFGQCAVSCARKRTLSPLRLICARERDTSFLNPSFSPCCPFAPAKETLASPPIFPHPCCVPFALSKEALPFSTILFPRAVPFAPAKETLNLSTQLAVSHLHPQKRHFRSPLPVYVPFASAKETLASSTQLAVSHLRPQRDTSFPPISSPRMQKRHLLSLFS